MAGVSYERLVRVSLGYARPSAELRHATSAVLGVEPELIWAQE